MKLEDFKKAKIEYMKQHDTESVNALNVIINKIMLAGIEKKAVNSELTEGDIVGIVQKAERELVEEFSAFQSAGRSESMTKLQLQIDTVRKYLPQLMSKEEIVAIVKALPDKSTPIVMKHFKTEYNGKCDMRIVSEVLKSLQ